MVARTRRADLVALDGLFEAGRLSVVTGRGHPLGEAAEAIRYVATGHVRGKVVIDIRWRLGCPITPIRPGFGIGCSDTAGPPRFRGGEDGRTTPADQGHHRG